MHSNVDQDVNEQGQASKNEIGLGKSTLGGVEGEPKRHCTEQGCVEQICAKHSSTEYRDAHKSGVDKSIKHTSNLTMAARDDLLVPKFSPQIRPCTPCMVLEEVYTLPQLL